MRTLPVSDEAIREAVNVIKSGGIVAHATETCYGFACDFTNEDAVQKLFALKKRPEGMPVSALFPSVEEAKKWVEWNEKAEELAKQYLPGPLTIILPLVGARHALPLPNQETLGVRISSHPIAQKLAELSDIPLSTTSANIHGKPSPYTAEEIVEQFSGAELQPDLILDSGTLPTAEPSTVVEIQENDLKILRKGSIHV